MAIDTIYSSLKHGLPTADADRVVSTLRRLGLSLDHPKLDDVDELFAGLEEFRQHIDDLEAFHIEELNMDASRFPGDFAKILED